MEKQYDLPVLGGEAYQNPLPFQNPEQTNPDPFVMPYRGRYYCYSSDAGGVNASVSDDLVHWEYLGYAMTEPGRQEYWAPCAIYHDGWFYLYYSTAPAGAFDCHQERLRVARSREPATGFEFVREFFETFTIDAHVVRDRGGALWLFYSTNEYLGCDENAAGTVILADRLVAPDQLEGEPREVTLPTIAQEIYEKNRFGDGRDWHTIEGAFYLEHEGRAYVMYSANAFVRENYFVGYSTAEQAGDIGALRWSKYPNDDGYAPLIRRSGVVEGTGHNSVAQAPNLVDRWVVYHGRNTADKLIEGTEQRQMRIDPLRFDGGRLATNAPSSQNQRAPRRPLVSSRFTEGSPLWKTLCGRCACTGDEALCMGASGGVTLHRLNAALTSYVLEVWCAACPTHMGARYGVLLWVQDALNYLELRFDAGKRMLSLVLSRGGVQTVLQTAPARFDFTAYHLVRAERRFDRFDVAVDGICLSACISLPEGCTGLFSRYTHALFSAFSLTESVSLWGDTLRYLPLLFSSDSPLRDEDGAICNRSPQTAVLRPHAEFTGDFTQEYRFVLLRADAEVRCTICEDETGAAQFFAAPGLAVLTDRRGGGSTELLRLTPEQRDFTLYLTFENGRASLWAHGYTAELSTEGAHSLCGEFSLHGAALRAFTMTNSKILK